MNSLDLRFFGNPEIYYRDKLLKLPTRKALALLVYLVVEGGSHSREKLVAMFWPDSAARLGNAALRNTLARLRSAWPEAGLFLLDQEGALGFDLEAPFTLDLQRVETAVGAIKAGQFTEAMLQAAVTAYRADFLEGFSLPDAPAFDDWVTFQREHRHYQLNAVFEALSNLHLERHEAAAGIFTALHWVAQHPLNEAAYRRLMQLHFLNGDRTAALQVYANCRHTLQQELGLEPSAETNALADRIRKDKGGSTKRGFDTSPPQQAAFNDLPFSGRAAEHAQLVAHYQAVRQGQSQVVIIHGEAGIGKTRLALEFLNWLVTQNADVLSGRAYEAGGRWPYQPIVEALRQRLEQENAPDDLLSDIWLAELSRLLPELHERYPDLPPPVADETTARTRLPEAVARLGQALAARGPVILFIDDVQWADAASLDLLHYLARTWAERGTAVLLLLTLRSEALLAGPSLETWLASLARETPLTQLSLEALTPAEISQLAQHLAGQRDQEAELAAFAAWLFRETAGQPLFIVESLKALLEQGRFQLQVDAAGRSRVDLTGLSGQAASLQGLIPPGVRQVILARLKRLTPSASALLTAAAVLGRDCYFEQLCQVAELGETIALPGLDEITKGRLLLEQEGSYRFSHDKIRDVIYTEAGDARRRVYHRRAFELLESAATPPAELAHHAFAARLVEPAFRYSVSAGEAAMALFAIRDAIVYYEQARSLVDQPLLALDSLYPLYDRLGRAYELQGEYSQAEAVSREMLAQARATQQPAMACAALNRLASLAIYSQQMDKATALLAEAKQIAEANGDKAGLAQTEWSLGQLTHHNNDFIASKGHSERALGLARELDDPALMAGASNTLAFALFFLGHIESAKEVMEAARAGYAALGNRALEADCLVGLASARLLNGEIEASVAAARAAYAIGQEIENAFGQSMSQAWLACALIDRGAYEEAVIIARRNLKAVHSQELAPQLVATFSAGFVYWALADAGAARSVHHSLMPRLVQAGVPGYLEQNAAHLCVDEALAGNWPAAHQYARQALAHRDYQALPLFIAPHWPETEALLRGGDLELAREDARRWGELVAQVPRYHPLYLRSQALLLQWEGNLTGAIACLEEAQTLVEAMALPGEMWQLLVKLAELYGSVGSQQRAGQALEQAREILAGLASNISDKALREGFLAREPVRSIISGA